MFAVAVTHMKLPSVFRTHGPPAGAPAPAISAGLLRPPLGSLPAPGAQPLISASNTAVTAAMATAGVPASPKTAPRGHSQCPVTTLPGHQERASPLPMASGPRQR